MTVTMGEAMAWVGAFFWPFIRIGAMFMVAPLVGTKLLSARVRLLLAVVVTIVVMPVLEPMPEVSPFSAEALMISAHQMMIGVAMGFILQLVFATLTIAGESIAMAMGLGFAMTVDPQNGVNLPVVSQFLTIVGTLLFMAFDGHLMLIQMIVASFQGLPVATTGLPSEAYRQIADWASNMFASALLIALPALAALLLTQVSMGVITRAAPQLNIFSVGFPATLLLGILMLYLTLPSIGTLFHEFTLQGFEFAYRLAGS